MSDSLRCEIVEGNIAVITWDLPGRPVNVMNRKTLDLFARLAKAAIDDQTICGVIVTSGKRDFIVGADLTEIIADRDPMVVHANTRQVQDILRAIEVGGKPFVAAINGSALGGGLEIALACHRRIMVERPGSVLGLPEVTLGLLPGAGGTQRLPRLIGVRKALPYLLEGKRIGPRDALADGIVDELVEPSELMAAATKWVTASSKESSVKPWDRRGFVVPDGPLDVATMYSVFAVETARVHAKTMGNLPAPRHILSSVYEGCLTDMDSGLMAEARHFTACLCSQEAVNLTRVSFFGVADAAKLKRRPQAYPKAEIAKVGVIGAGMMGAGIAYAAANAKLDVVLLDKTLAAAEQGRGSASAIVQRAVKRGRMSDQEASAVVNRIIPTVSISELVNCDIVVEAVFEDRSIKAEVIREADAILSDTTVLGSNTSTLPISGLAQASRRPENFVGIHFFSPVDRMRLVEIIKGDKTSDGCLARVMDFIKLIGKVPIVVSDSRGFYTTRVFTAYLNEGLAMVAEGVQPELIENGARQAGMAVGPLTLADEVSFDLLYRLMRQAQADLGDSYDPPAADRVISVFHDKLKRVGRKAGAGFYDYGPDGKTLYREIANHFPWAARQPSVAQIKTRFLHVQAVEALRCLDEGVVADPLDADVGALLGWSFPAHLGGPISLVHSIGIHRFQQECDELAKAHGPRFDPPPLLHRMVASGATLYPGE
ncbi:FAD-dependent oxidoreductase [Bradyrhizobium manausense]